MDRNVLCSEAMPEGKGLPRKIIPILLRGGIVCSTLSLAACLGGGGGGDPDYVQPTLAAKSKPVITVDKYKFKDLNANGKLDKYEDWRLSVDERINDLVAQMNDTEKVGMMMINDNNAGCAGAVTTTADDYINNQKMTRFILRSKAAASADPCDGSVTPGGTTIAGSIRGGGDGGTACGVAPGAGAEAGGGGGGATGSAPKA